MRKTALFLPLLLILPVSACAGSPDTPDLASASQAPAAAAASPAAADPNAADPAAAPADPADPVAPRGDGPADTPAAPAAKAPRAPKPEATTTKPKPKPTTKKPQLPDGRVPDFLVGDWTGGFGDETNRYLTITSNGRYERGFKSGGVESAGVVVANDSVATFHDTRGGREEAGLAYTDAAGIIVLSVDYADQGYYSYVPF